MRVAARMTVLRFVLAAAGAGASWGAAGCTTDVLHDLDEPSANQALSALERAGIAAGKTASESFTGGRYTVRVGNRQAVRALEVLKEQGLPREPRQGLAEIYARPGLIPSPAEERARFVIATVGDLERTLESVDGVLSARVHLVPAEVDPNALDGRSRTAARAAVLLRVKPGAFALGTNDLRQLVAGSIAGLEPGAVAVIVTRASDPAAPQPSALAPLGPFIVARSSRPLMIAASVIALGLIGVLAVLLLVTLRRRPSASADRK